MGWMLTLGLQNLRNQVNEAFPNRDKTSDGTIGDAAHQAETSGHNPDDTSGSSPEWNGDPDSTPEVRAWDMDVNLNAPPATAQQVVDHIRALPGVSSVLRYMIYNRKIYRASNGWTPETYDGKSAHTEHIHFSGAYSQAADNNQTFNFRLEEIAVAMTQADKDWIDARMDALTKLVAYSDALGGQAAPVGAAVLNSDYPARAGEPRNHLWVNLQGMQADIDAIKAKLGIA